MQGKNLAGGGRSSYEGGERIDESVDCKEKPGIDEEDFLLQIQSPYRIWTVERSPTEYSKGYDDDGEDESDVGRRFDTDEDSEWEERDLLEGRHSKMAPSVRSSSHRRSLRRFILPVVLVLAACIIGGVAIYLIRSKSRKDGDGENLIPPNPEVPLPPSPSIERRFVRAAVCSDGRPCSDVGSESWDFCAAALESTTAAVPQRRYSLSGGERQRWCKAISLCCQSTPVFCLYLQVFLINMSESHFDEYEHYNFEYDKHIHSGHSGKQRSKKEASEHTNHFDPCGHSRKILTKLQNTEQNKKTEPTKAKS